MSVTFASALDWAKKELGGSSATDDAAASASQTGSGLQNNKELPCHPRPVYPKPELN